MKNKSWTFNATIEHETNSLGWNNFVVVPEPLAQQIKAGVKDLRIKKSLTIAEHLIRNRGNLDFKELNEDFRRS